MAVGEKALDLEAAQAVVLVTGEVTTVAVKSVEAAVLEKVPWVVVKVALVASREMAATLEARAGASWVEEVRSALVVIKVALEARQAVVVVEPKGMVAVLRAMAMVGRT